jgi:hypothetical protein
MGKLKRFFRQADNAHHLEDCKAGLQHALEAFAVCTLCFVHQLVYIHASSQIQSSLSASAKLAEMQISEDSRQEELLALIAARATTTSSSDFSSVLVFVPGAPAFIIDSRFIRFREDFLL